MPIYNRPEQVGSSVANVISGGYNFTFTISPSSIITDPEDRPDLNGANEFNNNKIDPPGGTHPITGSPLTGGANTKWDVSRRIRVKVENPYGYYPYQLPPSKGGEFFAQPVKEDVPVQYPDPTSVIGNDDANTNDENNNPYQSFEGKSFPSGVHLKHEIGEISSVDSPSFYLFDQNGSDGNTFEIRDQFGEFVRLLIAGKWYRCSDFEDWRAHFKLIKQSGIWKDNQSELATDNLNF